MNFGRMLAHAFARRIAFIAVASVFGLLAYCGPARATDYNFADQGAAYAACSAGMSNAQGFVQGSPPNQVVFKEFGVNQACDFATYGSSTSNIVCSAGYAGPDGQIIVYRSCTTHAAGSDRYLWPTANTCASKAPYSTLFSPPGGSTDCRDGCAVTYTAMGQDSEGRPHSMVDYTGAGCLGGKDECNAKNPGGTSPPLWVWNSALGVCQPVQIECQEGAHWENGACTLDDGCPVGMVLNAQDICVKGPNDCPAGEVKGPDGACLNSDDGNKCPAGQAKGKDGTCKKDTDGDGVPDGEDGNEDGGKFSGGDDCNVPPTCSGDAILCGQARIQWRVDCNTRRYDAIAGGSCQNMPVCVGEKCKPIEHAMLIQQWKTACELEKLNAKTTGDVPSDDDGTATPGEPDYAIQQLTEDAAGADGDHGQDGDGPDGVFTDESKNNDGAGGAPGSAGELDDEGFGYSRSCPVIPDVNVFGTNVHFNIQPICDWVSLGGMIVLVLTSLLCLRIMSSSTQV